MSQKPNPTSIGLFIVAGVALGVIALLLFGSSRLFTKSHQMIAYFNESINGLSEGAPVKYRGVTIGFVKRIMVHFNQGTNDYAMPVILELQENLIRERFNEAREVIQEQSVQRQIQAGLRVSLQTESLVTGVLYVDIRPDPNAPPPVYHQLKKIYQELPTEPTQIQELFNNLASLDIKGIETNLNSLLITLDTTVGSLKMSAINQGITNLLQSLGELVSSLEVSNVLVTVRATFEQYRALGEKLNTRVDPLAESLTNSLAEANHALVEFRGAAENLKAMLGPDSPLRNKLDGALEQLAGAAESISGLADFLKQHPNALIAGRQPPKKQP